MLENVNRTVLLADPEVSRVKRWMEDPSAKKLPILWAINGKAAQLEIADRNSNLAAVLINPSRSQSDALSIIRACKIHRPLMPTFLVCDSTPFLDQGQIHKLGVQGLIDRDISYQEVIKIIFPTYYSFDVSKGPDRETADALFAEIQSDDSAFSPIRAIDYVAGSRSFFDIYLKLGVGRYVKVLQSGDAFDPDRIGHYIRKGVVYFYIRSQAQEQYLNYCDHIASSAVNKKNLPAKIKTRLVIAQGEEVIKFIKLKGLAPNNLSHASSFIDNIGKLVDQIDLTNKKAVDSFLKDAMSCEHGVATTILTALLLRPLHFTSERTMQNVGLASLFHDVGLQELPEEVQKLDRENMNPAQFEIYKMHPELSAKILKEFPGIDPIVVQAVAQHHERRNKKGFPNRLGTGSINRIAEILGICDEFVTLLNQYKKDPSLNVFAEMTKNIFDGFSLPVVEAFQSLFPGQFAKYNLNELVSVKTL